MRKPIWTALIIAALLLPATNHAQSQKYEPSYGQEGKDVIWVPTPDELVQAMLDLAKVTPNDIVMDLGSGDGRIVIAAARRGARATGIEYNPDMVELSRSNAEKAGVSGKATFLNADLFAADFSQATVITMYLLPALNLKLRPTILNLKPGTRVVAHAFNMGEWQYDQSVEREGRTAYLWIVPAKVTGTWTWPTNSGNAELKLTQIFQTIEGSLKLNGKEMALKNAKLEGSHITFNCGNEEYSGQVNGKGIEGIVGKKWSATLK
jgi:SAM-dependent methyltransferase